MKYFTIICVLFMCSFSQAEQVDQAQQEGGHFFETAHGNINLGSLESILSSAIEAPVTELTLRLPYNPINRYLNNNLTNYRTFVMSFVIDNSHKMSCELDIIKLSNKIMINDCESKTAFFHNDIGLIDIRDVGLPLITKNY